MRKEVPFFIEDLFSPVRSGLMELPEWKGGTGSESGPLGAFAHSIKEKFCLILRLGE